MSQEIKTMVRTITPASSLHVDQELSMLCAAQGWSLHSTHYIRLEKGGHDVMYILVREAPVREVKFPVGTEVQKAVELEEKPKRGPGRPIAVP